jgi:hypothetical protein
MANRIAATLACCAALHCTAAFAQWDPGFTASLGRGYGQIALSQSVLTGMRLMHQSSSSGAGAASAPAAGAKRAPADATLTYVADPRISEQVRGAMIAALSQQNPAMRPQMERAFANDAVLRNFDRFMRSRGWSSHNVADDMTILLLMGWEIATGRSATEAQMAGAQQQVRGVFLETPQLRAMTNADRQEMGERIAYQVVISSLAHEQSVRSGDQAQLAQLRQSAAAMLQQQGIDLTRVTLTDHGFRAAS